MCKKRLREDQMSTAVIDDCRRLAGYLVSREIRGNGDTDNAMRRVEQRYGVPFSTLWPLRYRPPRDIGASILARLVAAYQAETSRQQKLAAHELSIAKASGPASALVRAASSLAESENQRSVIDDES
jgi:hypothetical protein